MRALRIKRREPCYAFTAAIAKVLHREATLFLRGLVCILVSSYSTNAQSGDRAPSQAQDLRFSRLFELR